MTDDARSESTAKTVVVMQPYLFPYLGYFQLLAVADEIVLLDDVQFTRRGWMNRNRIARPDGSEQRLVLPVEAAPQGTLMCDIRISEQYSPDNMFEAIRHTYAKAPEFSRVAPAIRDVLFQTERSLVPWLTNGLETIFQFVGIPVTYRLSSALQPVAQLRGVDRILDICHQLGASRYVNAPGGRELYEHSVFESEGLSLAFLEPRIDPYERAGGTTSVGLSILDELMYLPADEVAQRIRSGSLGR